MTNEEAIKQMEGNKRLLSMLISKNGWSDIDTEPFDIAISTLEKQNKYRWHDLLKDPEDLPMEEGRKYIITQCGTKKYHIANWMDGSFGEWGISPLADCTITFNEFATVDRWREIEPFEEGE